MKRVRVCMMGLLCLFSAQCLALSYVYDPKTFQPEDVPETAEPIYYFTSVEKETDFLDLINSLKCPVCEYETLAESNTPEAMSLKMHLAIRVERGDFPLDLEYQYVKEFGEKTRLKTRFHTKTYMLWSGPLILIILVWIILRETFTRRRI